MQCSPNLGRTLLDLVISVAGAGRIRLAMIKPCKTCGRCKPDGDITAVLWLACVERQRWALVVCSGWNSMGPTPTPTRTLGMRLSCNFVNVHTIAYRVQYTYTRASLTDILARKSARQTSRRTSRRGCPCRCRSHGIPALPVDCVGSGWFESGIGFSLIFSLFAD